MQFKSIGELIKLYKNQDSKTFQKILKESGDLTKAVELLKNVKGINVDSKFVLLKNAFNGVSDEAINTALGINKIGTSVQATSLSLKTLGSAAKGAFTTLASNPLTWVVAATVAVGALVKHLSDVYVSAEEANEKMDNSFSAYESAKSEVEAINTELETTQQRIDDLNNKAGLSFIEEEELQKLKDTTEQLKIQQDIAEKERGYAAKEAAESAKVAYEKNYGEYDTTQADVDEYYSTAKISGNYAGLIQDNNISSTLAGVKIIDEQIDEAKRVLDELSDSKDEDAIKYAQEEVERLEGVRDDSRKVAYAQLSALLDYKTKLESLPEEYKIAGQDDILKELEEEIALIYQNLDPAKWKQMRFDELINSDSIKEAKDELVSMVADTDNIKLSVEALQRTQPEFYKSLSEALRAEGFSMQDFVDYVNSEANIIDEDALTQSLKDTNGRKIDKLTLDTSVEIDPDVTIDPDTAKEEFNAWVDTLTLEEKQIVEEAFRNTELDTTGWTIPDWESYVQKMLSEAQSAIDSVEPISFSSLFTNEEGEQSDFSKNIDKFQSDIGTIQSALDSLESGEKVDLTDLLQQFPELIGQTDNLNESLTNLKNQKISNVIADIFTVADNNGINSSEQIGLINSYISNMLSSIDLRGIDTSEIKTAIMNALLPDGGDSAEIQIITDKISSIFSNIEMPKFEDVISNEHFKSQVSEYQSMYSSLREAQDSLSSGTSKDTVLTSLYESLPKEYISQLADDTDDLDGAIENLLEVADNNILDYFNEQIEQLRANGDNLSADRLQAYADAVMNAAKEIEMAAVTVGGVKFDAPALDAYNKALETENEGSTYDSIREALEKTKELYDKGLVGTDDFKKGAAIFSSNGMEDATNFMENYDKALRYMTEDETGVKNFLEDLETKGYASMETMSDGTKKWSYEMEDLEAAAHDMGMSFDWFMSMFGKLSDYGFNNDFFGTVEEGQTHLNDLYSELSTEEAKLKELRWAKKDGDTTVTDTVIDEQEARVAQIRASIESTMDLLDVLASRTAQDYEEQAKSAQQTAQTLVDQLGETSSGSVRAMIEADIRELAEKYQLDIQYDESTGEIVGVVEKGLETAQQAADENPITVKTETQQAEVETQEANLTVGSNTEQAIENADNAVSDIEDKSPVMKITGDNSSARKSGEVAKNYIENLDPVMDIKANDLSLSTSISNVLNKPWRMNINANVSGLPQGGLALGTAHAEGTTIGMWNDYRHSIGAYANGTSQNWALQHDETALVNEVGQESIVRDGVWSLLPGGAHVESLKKNDIIFNARQTEELMKYGKVLSGGGHGRVALADGTAHNTINLLPAYALMRESNTAGNSTKTAKNSGFGGGYNPLFNDKPSSTSDKVAKSLDNTAKKVTESAKKFSDWISSLFDWAEVRMTRLSRLTDKWTSKAEQAVRYSYNEIDVNDSRIDKQYSKQRRYTQKAITATDNEIAGNKKSIDTYNKQLAKIKSKGKLSNSDIEKIKNDTNNGTFDIESFGSDKKKETLEAIQAYQEYYEKVLNCKDSIYELQESQKDLYDQLYNIPIEQATAKVERYERAISRLEAAMSSTAGGSKIYLTQLVKDSEKSYQIAETAVKTAENNTEVAEKKLSNAADKVQNTKGISKKQKRRAKNGKKISTKGLKGKALKRANAYNNALEDYNSAEKAERSANNRLTDFAEKRDSARKTEEQFADAPDYAYQNYLLDEQIEQNRLINETNQDALRTANSNVDKSKRKKKNRSEKVKSKGENLLDKYKKQLSSEQEKDIKAGKEVSTKGLSGKALAAVKAYNKAVRESTKASQEYASAVEAQIVADENAAESQAAYTQAIQENAKAKFDNVNASHESRQSVTESEIDQLSSILDNREATGKSKVSDGQKAVYEGLMNENLSLLEQRRQQLADARKAFEENSANMSEQDRQDALATINALETAVINGESEVANLQDEINKIEVTKLELGMERLQERAENLQDSMSLKKAKGLSSTASDYNALINNSQEQVANLEAQNALLIAQRDSYEVNSEKWLEAQKQIDANASAIRDAQQNQIEWNNAMAQLPYNTLEKALELLDAIAAHNKSEIDLKSARGEDLSEDDYLKQIEDNNAQIVKLEEERVQAYADYQKALTSSDGTYGGKTAEEWKAEYLGYGTEINDVKQENEELKDSLRDDVYWRTFERAHESAKRFSDILSGLSELISDDMYFDKDGKMTEYGIAQTANLTKQYETARQEVQNYSADIANLNKLYAEGKYTEEEFKEKLAELQAGALDSASTMKDLENSIIDMYKSQAQAELEGLFEIIDARNEALAAKKAYYDYDRNVRNQNKNLQTLNAEIAALEGIEDAASKAKRAQLEAQREEAQQALDDTIQGHMLEMSQESLNELKTILQDEFDDKWEYVSQDLDEIVVLMTTANELSVASIGTVNATMNKLLEHYGIDPVATGVNVGYARGSKHVARTGMARINENGQEIVVRPNGDVMTILQKGDIIPNAHLSDNLFRYGAMSPERFANGIINSIPTTPTVTQAGGDINQHYDALINVEGNLDSVTGKEVIGIIHSQMPNIYNYTVKEISRDAKKIGVQRKY